jgi:Flp pilus assembly protein TadD
VEMAGYDSLSSLGSRAKLKPMRNRVPVKISIAVASAIFLFGIAFSAAAQGTNGSKGTNALSQAKTLLMDGKPQQAEELVLSYISKSSPHAAAYNLLGMIYDAQKHFDLAAGAYRKAIELAPGAASPHVNLGINCLQRGQNSLAIQEFLTALRIDPNNVTAATDLAEVCLDLKRYNDAAKYFELARKLQPNDPLILLGLAKAYFSSGNEKQAMEAAGTLRKLPSIGPPFHFSLALLLAQHGDFNGAVAEFQKVVAAGVESHELFLNLGFAFSHLKQFEMAKENYFKAIESDPGDAAPYLRVGVDYLAQKNQPLAIVWLMRANQISPRQPEILYLLGTALMEEKYYKTAQDYLREYLQERDQDPKGWALLGDAYLNDDMQYDQALDCYRHALALKPNLASANYLVGYAYYLVRNLPEAKRYLLKALELAPSYAEAHLRLAEVAYMGGNDKEVIRQLLPLSTNQMLGGQIPYVLAKSYVREKDDVKAENLLMDLTRRYPQDPRFHFLLAQLYQRLGKVEAAQEQMNLHKATDRDEKLRGKLAVNSYPTVQ